MKRKMPIEDLTKMPDEFGVKDDGNVFYHKKNPNTTSFVRNLWSAIQDRMHTSTSFYNTLTAVGQLCIIVLIVALIAGGIMLARDKIGDIRAIQDEASIIRQAQITPPAESINDEINANDYTRIDSTWDRACPITRTRAISKITTSGGITTKVFSDLTNLCADEIKANDQAENLTQREQIKRSLMERN